jgi:hypothetical protein
MALIDKIKAHLKEDTDTAEVEKLLTEATAYTPEGVKEFVSKAENQPVYDSLVSKAVASHIEKEKIARSEWETTRSAEMLAEAMEKIEKDKQKSPLELEVEQLKAERAQEKADLEIMRRKEALNGIVSSEKLPLPSVDLYASLGDDAETRMREEANKINALIDARLNALATEKFGKGSMDGGADPTPTPTPKPTFGSGNTTAAALDSLNKATEAAKN